MAGRPSQEADVTNSCLHNKSPLQCVATSTDLTHSVWPAMISGVTLHTMPGERKPGWSPATFTFLTINYNLGTNGSFSSGWLSRGTFSVLVRSKSVTQNVACKEIYVKLFERTWCHCGSPGTALFLLCLALHQESQQPLSENKGTPGERDNKRKGQATCNWSHFELQIFIMT